jgi:hypothetical protein
MLVPVRMDFVQERYRIIRRCRLETLGTGLGQPHRILVIGAIGKLSLSPMPMRRKALPLAVCVNMQHSHGIG